MFWISLLSACFHGPPTGPSPSAQAAKIHTPLLVESPRSHVGISLLVRGGSAADPIGKEGAGSLLWQNASEGASIEAFRKAGGQFRSEWRRDYGSFHYRWAADEDLEGPLLELMKSQLQLVETEENLAPTLARQIQEKDTMEADRGLPSLLDAWLQLGLAGHPYAHPSGGTWASRANLSPQDLQAAANRLFCTGNFHVAVSAKTDPTLPPSIEKLLNAQGPCQQEPPTPKPLPLAQGSNLLVLKSRGAGTHAFAGLPHRSTSHKTNDQDLAWGAALLAGTNNDGPLQRAFDLREIEASIKVRLSPVGERWEQPLIQISVRSQDADPIVMFDALTTSLMGLNTSGWTARDHHRHNQHLSETKPAPSTQERLESQLVATVFGPTPRAKAQSDASETLEALQQGIQAHRLSLVMEVSETEPLVEYAREKGFDVQVLSAQDFLPKPQQ
jgi:hypothetical protein